MVETEIKLPWKRSAAEAQELIVGQGYSVIAPRILETDQVFDRSDGELKQTDKLLRLRRSGTVHTVTYKGPSARQRYKSREEIEFLVDGAEAFELVLDRLGYYPRFRYEKYRTKFALPGEPGIVTLDETPMGVFLELEGSAEWIDRTAERLGFTHAAYSTASYSSLYRAYRAIHADAPENMVFGV
jgi:adenylate cyclase class 2